MAPIVYRNAYLWINGVDYSGDIVDLSVNYSAAMLDATAMGADTKINKGGLKSWDVKAKALQNFATGHVGANLFALVGTTTCIEFRPDNSCSTSANPSFSGIAVLQDHPPAAGTVGSLLPLSFSLMSAGTLNRASSS